MADTTTTANTFHSCEFLAFTNPTQSTPMLFQQFLSYMCSFIIPSNHPRIKPEPVYKPVVPYANILTKSKDGCCQSSFPATSGLKETLEGSEVCCVCLSRLKEECEELRALPCTHLFHRVCIDRWLDVCPRTCPLCRFSMDAEGAGGEGGGRYYHSLGVITDEMLIWFSSFHA